MRGLMWFRSDLRANDNTALFNASRHCRDGLLGVFFIPTQTWASYHMAPSKVDLILRQLKTLKAQLETANIPLWVITVDNYAECITQLKKICADHDISALYYNREYELNELMRDEKVDRTLREAGVSTHPFDDLLIAPPGKILTPKAKPYSVFTPFKKAWLAWMPRHGNLQPLGMPELQVDHFAISSDIPRVVPGFESSIDSSLWPAGADKAQERLEAFVKSHLLNYAKTRDYPILDATSKLSPYLNIGALSVRLCLSMAVSASHIKSSEDVDAWVSELIWREFYKHVSFHFPRVCKGLPFHEVYDNMTWEHRPEWIDAFKRGETGFPLVDAGIRQMLQTGFMHNRVRMVSSMFFSKVMYQDWHIGENFFMEHLVDGDFSANNGGWQWCASTGTDAAPYFRMFNPIRQSETFDAEGEYIKQYIPELRDFTPAEIHEPYVHNPLKAAASGYPRPILDFSAQRKITMASYKEIAAG